MGEIKKTFVAHVQAFVEIEDESIKSADELMAILETEVAKLSVNNRNKVVHLNLLDSLHVSEIEEV